MPKVKIAVTRFRELQMGATEKDFLHHFGFKLAQRGFRLVPGRWVRDENGIPIAKVDPEGNRFIASPPLVYDRKTEPEFLIVSQEVPGRVHDKHANLVALLAQVRAGYPNAVSQLYSFLLSEGDDRDVILASLEVDSTEDVMMTSDSLTQKGSAGQPDDAPLVSSAVIAQRQLIKKILLLFGAIEENL